MALIPSAEALFSAASLLYLTTLSIRLGSGTILLSQVQLVDGGVYLDNYDGLLLGHLTSEGEWLILSREVYA